MIFSFTVPCFATDYTDHTSGYPYVFIPGMVGWGTDYPGYDKFPYWGGGFTIGQYDNLIDILNLAGIEAYATNPGPFNSAWDRTCEVYAALTGTVVDYGEAHSKEHNHDRYGFSYEGKALMGEAWNLQDKINLLGYSAQRLQDFSHHFLLSVMKKKLKLQVMKQARFSKAVTTP